MIAGITHSRYQVILLSENYYLWLGLKSLISVIVSPRPDIFWFSDLSPESILRLREQVLSCSAKNRSVIFTDPAHISDMHVFLPAEKICLVADDLSIGQLHRMLKTENFALSRYKEPTLTCCELRVCSLISQGISMVRIAQLLNKSPKTIYTHKRNAMAKFNCHSLAEFHRKICQLEHRSLWM